ncbi:hypothetical protein GOODEAATRI_012611, partial [Goodea atripinnis]
LMDDLDSKTSHLLHLSLGNFVCQQVRCSPVPESYVVLVRWFRQTWPYTPLNHLQSALLNLLLTGRASPHVFNGTLQFGEDGQPLEHPLQGVLSRSDVGYLHWSREQMDRGGLPQVGSMLKTPRFPVWVCCINSSYSVLFSLNRSLLSDWRMEHQFKLFYFNGQNCQRATAQLTVGLKKLMDLMCQEPRDQDAPSVGGQKAPVHRHQRVPSLIRPRAPESQLYHLGTNLVGQKAPGPKENLLRAQRTQGLGVFEQRRENLEHKKKNDISINPNQVHISRVNGPQTTAKGPMGPKWVSCQQLVTRSCCYLLGQFSRSARPLTWFSTNAGPVLVQNWFLTCSDQF